MQAPLLAAISLAPTGGGIAGVARLMWRALRARWEGARLTTLVDGVRCLPSFGDKARFALTLAGDQVLRRADGVIFDHLALARVEAGIPSRLRVPYAVFVHGVEVWRPLSRRERRVLAGAQVRMANSHYTANRTMEMHPDIGEVAACPLALSDVPHCVDDAAGVTAASGLPPLGSHVVLIVGRMSASERYKGHDQLLAAWPAVLAAVPDAQLVVVGQGDDQPRLRRAAARVAGGARIVFTGFVDDDVLDALYRQAAVFALPSRGEGFGLVYLEAMARRVPCIGSVHDAAREVIVDGQTGTLVDQDRNGDLAEAIVALLRDETLRRRMGDAGYRRVVETFGFDRFADRLCGLVAGLGGPVVAGSRYREMGA